MQGDIGEWSAIGWLINYGAKVFLPLGHSADVDLVADLDGRLVSVQVKTSTVARNARYEVTLATRGAIEAGAAWSSTSTRADAITSSFTSVMGDVGLSRPGPWRVAPASCSGGRSTTSTRSSRTVR
jgi:hypothetical protein